MMRKEQHNVTSSVTHPGLPPHALQAPSPFLYERIGGRPGIRRLVTAFYRRVALDPGAADLRAMHTDIAGARMRLERFLVEWLGGPKAPVNARKPTGLRARHFSFRVGHAEKSIWMRCMSEALDETVQDPKLKSELEAAFEQTARGIVNRDTWNGT
ncbi:MAG TPA: hypothetical protein VFQ35_27645 [Polyangiaceae bacterium]|nr:hypothetical protein [Polyangiaceae bacterium]